MQTGKAIVYPDRQAPEADRLPTERLRERGARGYTLERNGRDRSRLTTVRGFQRWTRRGDRPSTGRLG